jgi:hypothetical protein
MDRVTAKYLTDADDSAITVAHPSRNLTGFLVPSHA